MAKKDDTTRQIIIAVASGLILATLAGFTAWANAQDNRTQSLEASSTAQGQSIRALRLKLKEDQSSQQKALKELAEVVRTMKVRVDWMAQQQGFVPPEMGNRGTP